MRPLVVVEGGAGPFADALAEARDRGWTVVAGWDAPAADRVVCSGVVADAETAARALLAALGGAGLVVHAEADRDIVDRLCDDLRRLGPVDHRPAGTQRSPRLTRDEGLLLEALAAGRSLGEAARSAGLSRRTADRRLAAARAKLGVQTTAEAVVDYERRKAG